MQPFFWNAFPTLVPCATLSFTLFVFSSAGSCTYMHNSEAHTWMCIFSATPCLLGHSSHLIPAHGNCGRILGLLSRVIIVEESSLIRFERVRLLSFHAYPNACRFETPFPWPYYTRTLTHECFCLGRAAIRGITTESGHKKADDGIVYQRDHRSLCGWRRYGWNRQWWLQGTLIMYYVHVMKNNACW